MSRALSASERTNAIAELAYRLWEERGCPDGSPDEDWYKAEVAVDDEQNGQIQNDPAAIPPEQVPQAAKTAA